MYDYYKLVQDEEHMLYAKEIASYYKLYEEKDSSTIVSAVTYVRNKLNEYVATLDDYEQLYYSTRNGLAKVYPRSIYEKALSEVIELPYGKSIEVNIGNKKYKIIKR